MIPGLKKLYFISVDGSPKILKECSVLQFDNLKILYSLFWDQICELDPVLEKSFTELIGINKDILETALSITRLLGVDDSWLSIDSLAALTFSYKDSEGQPHRGLIWEKYFENIELRSNQNQGETVSWDDHKFLMMAGLAQSEGGIESALRIMGELSNDELIRYFEKRAELIQKQNPDSQDAKVANIRKFKEKFKEKFGDLQPGQLPGVKP